MEFSTHIRSLFVLSLCSNHGQLQSSDSNRLVSAGTDVPESINVHTNCTALQEELHECVGWFTTSSNGLSVHTSCHISVSPAIIQK